MAPIATSSVDSINATCVVSSVNTASLLSLLQVLILPCVVLFGLFIPIAAYWCSAPNTSEEKSGGEQVRLNQFEVQKFAATGLSILGFGLMSTECNRMYVGSLGREAQGGLFQSLSDIAPSLVIIILLVYLIISYRLLKRDIGPEPGKMTPLPECCFHRLSSACCCCAGTLLLLEGALGLRSFIASLYWWSSFFLMGTLFLGLWSVAAQCQQWQVRYDSEAADAAAEVAELEEYDVEAAQEALVKHVPQLQTSKIKVIQAYKSSDQSKTILYQKTQAEKILPRDSHLIRLSGQKLFNVKVAPPGMVSQPAKAEVKAAAKSKKKSSKKTASKKKRSSSKQKRSTSKRLKNSMTLKLKKKSTKPKTKSRSKSKALSRQRSSKKQAPTSRKNSRTKRSSFKLSARSKKKSKSKSVGKLATRK